MSNKIERSTFFSYARRAPFGNRLTPQQVNGMEAMLALWERKYSHLDIRFLSYILATVFHETGGLMVPVREGFAKTDAAARKVVASRKYGKPDATSDGKPGGKPTGHVYYGRGPVQLTWKDNYKRMGAILGIDLVNDPDLALDPVIGNDILFEGMIRGASGKGDFTGKALEDFFNDTTDDPAGARRIINGTDKQHLIASYYASFHDALKASQTALHEGTPDDVTPASATPDGANLLTDKTVWGASIAGVGGFAASLVGAINNPWALAAFAIVALGLFLCLTGRIEIKTKAGA